MSMEASDEGFFPSETDYQKKLRYEQFKLYAKRQNSSYFAENPRFMKFFKTELESNNLGSIVKNNTELY